MGLRLVVVDATDTGSLEGERGGGGDGTSRRTVGLTPIWKVGAGLFAAIGSVDAHLAARSWKEALTWAAHESAAFAQPITSFEAWGHGGFGFMRLGDEALDVRALAEASPLARELDAFEASLAPDALVWLRCCSAFGGKAGRLFAPALASRLGRRVAGHTHIIGFFQSGLHTLAPHEVPAWDPREGVRFEGGKEASARTSSPRAPNTITCLRRSVPEGY